MKSAVSLAPLCGRKAHRMVGAKRLADHVVLLHH